MTARRALFTLALVAATAFLVAQAQDRRQPGPADAGQTEKGASFQEAKIPLVTPRPPAPLRVERLEANELAEGTQTGSPGDLLLTFHGQGFQETAKAPRVEIGGKTVFDDTMVDLEGTQLFVVVPRGRLGELQALRFQEIVVANPGAREKTDYSRTTVRAAPADLRPAAGAPRARLVFRRGVFVRELVQR
ncbi:MAG TPA: hypothetical protein VFQ51_02305 [Vicinamibacteria bacterium]|nr:hypothetical protein [Vicinamibacteria bacterium]